MKKYVIKESVLLETIRKVIAEEMSDTNIVSESVGSVLGSALKNTLKYGALGTVAPSILANKMFSGANDIVNHDATVTDAVKKYLGLDNSDKNWTHDNRSDAHHTDMSREYGTPVTVPDYSRNKTKLAEKEIISVSSSESKNGIEWGSFGRHYLDEKNTAWNRKLNSAETYFTRHSIDWSQDVLKKKLKNDLIKWLNDRDVYFENIAH